MNKHISYMLLCLIVSCGLFAAPFAHAGANPKLVVIAVKGSRITNLTMAQLKRVFLGDNVIVEGVKLVPFNFGLGTPERDRFDQLVLGMSGEILHRFWVDRKIRGQSDAPRALPSVAFVLKVATKFPGAVAYVPVGDLSGEVQPISVDGVAYTHAKYLSAQ